MSFDSFGKASEQVLYRLGGEKYQRFIHVFLCWKKVVGELLASRSHPQKLEHNTLFIAVQNNTWMQELLLLKSDILSKYKNIFEEEIAELVFVISIPKRKCIKRK